MSEVVASKKVDYAESKDEELIKFAYENLKGVPHIDDYEKMISGMKYDGYVDELIYARALRHEKAQDYGLFRVKDFASKTEYNKARADYVAEIFGQVGEGCFMEYPFRVDYGYNISVGRSFYSNFNLTILDCSIVKIGDYVMCGPNVTILTATHPTDPTLRKAVDEWAKPVFIGDNVWLGAGSIVLPGVKIGDNAVIGAGSVVSRDIPANCVAVGVPCRVQKYVEAPVSAD